MDAGHGIKRLREEPREYGFYLRGTLASMRSVYDYILEEYNQKFGLGFTLDEKLTSQLFRDRAKERKNKDALRFIRAFDKGWQKLMNDPELNALLGESGERNIIMHRKHSMIQVQNVRLTPDQRYEDVGKATLHFRDRKDGVPSKLEIPDQCDYCLSKLGEFRGSLVFRY